MLSHIPNVTRLSQNVVRILGFNPGFFTLQGTNTYLIGNTQKRILLDTGEKENKDYLDCLKDYLKQNNLIISSIIISHWHSDHIGGVPEIVKNLNLKNVKIYKMKHENDIDYQFDYIDKETILKESGVLVKLIPTPGHTPDHVIVYLEDEATIFSGDCLLGEGSSVFEDLGDYLNSLKLMLNLNANKIYPGHGKVIDNPSEKIKQCIDHRLERERSILNELNNNKVKSVKDIVNVMYENLPEKLYLGACYNVQNHLNKLIKDGRVRELIDNNDSETKVYLRV